MATRVTSAKFVGRDAELAELQAALDDAVEGRPSLVFVAGESGVGKTRLVTELGRLAEEQGVRVLRGECVELGEGELPYAPLVAALRPLSRRGDPEAREALDQLLPGVAMAQAGQRDEAGAARGRLFEALIELLDQLAGDTGLLLTIEDLHWADRSTRAFLAFLAASLDRARVLVIATYRPDELHRRHPLRPLLAELERDARAQRLDLRPLTRDELAQQLADILGAPASADLVDRLWARSEGNPLFAEELLAAGLDGRGALPPTLREAFMVRVERLPADAQELMRVLAAGRRLDHAVLAAAAGLDPRALREALREAVASQLVVVDDEGRYAFRHALLREVVHDDLLPGEHAELHLALARALEARASEEPAGAGAHLAAGIAHHYRSAGDQPAALAASVRAGEAAERVHAYGEAAALYERALELWERVPDAEQLAGVSRVRLYRLAAWCHSTEHDPARAETLLRAALALIDEQADAREAARVLERIARTQWNLGRADESKESRSRALALLPAGEDSPERATILASIAKELMLASRYREAVDAATEAIAVARAARSVTSEVRAHDALGIALAGLGRHDDGFAALREAIRLARAGDMPMTMLVSYVNLADALNLAGRLEEARAVTAEALAYAREHDMPHRWLDLQSAELAFEAGEWLEADRMLPDSGRRTVGSTYLNEAARQTALALGRGEHERARRLLDEADVLGQSSREPQFIAPQAAARAELERRAGDLDAARAAVDDGLDRIEFCSEDVARISMVATVGLTIEADAAVRARDLGDAAAEQLALDRAETMFMRVEATAAEAWPIECANLATARAELARARSADDPQLWAAAAAEWTALARPYPAAQARQREAEARLARGDRAAAGSVVAGVIEACRRIGAAWLCADAEGFAARARLRLDEAAAGGVPAPPPASSERADPFGLTPRERQVLELLADGRTNREIGHTLFMAEKTASVHVSRILSKLDVRSRTEAAAVAHRLGLQSTDPAGGR